MKRVTRPLHIVWQRLVNSSGQTCNRCGDTYKALRDAVAKLKDALGPLGLEPMLETKEINEESFKGDPSESNRIWIAGHSLEEWLGARVGSSPVLFCLWLFRMSHGRCRGSRV